MENYLEYHFRKYPKSEIQDFIKLTYQATFGTEHMITNPAESLSYLKEEIAYLHPVDFYEDLYDYISPDYVRVNLRVYKQYNLNVNLLNESFNQTANIFVDNDKTFKGELEILKNFLIKKGFDISALDNYYQKLVKNNYPSVHHTKTYRDAYHPAYRVIHQKYLTEELQYYQVRHYLDGFDKGKVNFFALEGKSASGKTAIANLLEKDDDITIIPVEDFFDNSYDEIGINSLRIIKDIFNPAVVGKQLKYKKYNLQTKIFEEVTIESLNPIVVIVGIYSSNPILEKYYNGIIYIDLKEETQKERLLKINRLLSSRFTNDWVLKENNYFEKFNPFKKADIIV
jgi:dephospho-CoA kinase